MLNKSNAKQRTISTFEGGVCYRENLSNSYFSKTLQLCTENVIDREGNLNPSVVLSFTGVGSAARRRMRAGMNTSQFS